MDDPCRHCDKRKERDLFLAAHYIPLSRLQGTENGERLEHALKKQQESEDRYKHLIECAPDAIFIADAETGAILDVNRQASVLLGIPVNQIIGMHHLQLHPKEDTKKYKKMFHERVRNGTVTFDDDVYVCRNDGRNIPVHINAMVTQIGNKKVVYGIFRDITELKKLQQKLADSEQKYHNLYNQAQVALFVTDLNGLLLDCNLAAVELFGYSADEMKENYLHKVCVTDHYIDKERRKQFLTELQKNLQIKNFEAQLKRTDGTLLWVSIFARLSPDKGYIEGALYDITPSKILTKTERIILDVILQGKSNKEIAKILNRSVRTVEDHRAHIMHKLNAGNLVELVQKTQFFKFEPNGQSKK